MTTGAKLNLLLAAPVPVVSFTFGLPHHTEIAALQDAGTRVLATVTTAEEAGLATEVGVDAVIVQGAGAGGHSAIFDPHQNPSALPLTDRIAQVRTATRRPIIAAGGVDGPAAVRVLLDAGADAVAVGTLLLRVDEAGTIPTHRAALVDPSFDGTLITRAFTGRPARALRNGFMDRHGDAPTAYPALHHLTRELRHAAGQAGDADRLHLWAGTGYRRARTGPAADTIAWLATELTEPAAACTGIA